MKLTCSTSLTLLMLPLGLFADTQSLYCPQNHAYINIGMSPDQVIAACGQPLSQQDSNQPVLQKIPMQQLIYNNKAATSTFYGLSNVAVGNGSWNLPTGNGGAQLEINIVDKRVKSIKLNGSESNAVSICGGHGVQVGDPIEKVYYTCGTPSLTNSTYINQLVPTAEKPKVWIYQPGQYQPSVTLTFVDGRLQSIN